MCYTLSDHCCKQFAILLVLVLQRKAKQIPCDAHTAVSFVSTVCLSAGNFFFHGIKSYLLAKESEHCSLEDAQVATEVYLHTQKCCSLSNAVYSFICCPSHIQVLFI